MSLIPKFGTHTAGERSGQFGETWKKITSNGGILKKETLFKWKYKTLFPW